ncbi:hypothetical protein [Lewinella sp. W8]|uniref:hypothetical protein n=1 Tax=Lewinella sp. W8 TaxID=2528208 RepID=UPI001068C127|nr:hypothetical protein [Lewinella sp. W8]MTB53582.1 hypothetical protein [Lewinella sp. W8]
MKQLQELAGVPSRATVRQILKGNGQVKATESLTHKLYDLVRKGDLDDDGIVKKLYGNNRTPSYGPYRTLKTRLRHILVQAILLDEVEMPKFSTYNDAYKHGYRQLAIARILISQRAYTSAREIGRYTYNQVKPFEIVSILKDVTDLLSSLYLGVGYNEEKFNEFDALCEYYTEAEFAVAKLQRYMRRIRNGIYAHRDSPYEIGQQANKYFMECYFMIEKYPNVSLIQSLLADLEVTGCMLRGEYIEAISASERGSARLSKCHGVSRNNLGFLALNSVECTLRIGDFSLGLEQISKAKEMIPAQSINGIKLLELSIRLGLLTGEYKYSYLQLTSLDRKFLNRVFTPRHIEYWRIIEAYVHLLISAGKIPIDNSDPKLPKFRLNRFLNNVPTYARNKRGMNIQILIIQAMFLIIERKYSLAIDRVESLERYCSRYLKKDENFRNNCFFKLLTTAINANFNRTATKRKSAVIYQKMISADELKSHNVLEWIPYEKLWEILLDSLVEDRKMSVA